METLLPIIGTLLGVGVGLLILWLVIYVAQRLAMDPYGKRWRR